MTTNTTPNLPHSRKEPAMGEDIKMPEPTIWVRRNAGHISGVAHFGRNCPPGWVAAASPFYTADQLRAAVEADRVRHACQTLHLTMGNYGVLREASATMLAEKDALLRQALRALEAYSKSGYVRHEHPKKYAAGNAVAEAIRNHLGVKND